MLNSISKILIVPMLYLSFSSFASFVGIDLGNIECLIFALLFYTVGDLLMELDGKFKLGSASFLAGHVLYMAYFLSLGFAIQDAIFWGILWFSSFFLYFSSFVPVRGDRLMTFYAAVLLLFGMIAGASGESGFYLHKIYAFFGVVAFTFSDSILVLQKRRGDEKDEMLVMFTYVSANVLLLLSAIFASIGL